jgi:hypothetical protein
VGWSPSPSTKFFCQHRRQILRPTAPHSNRDTDSGDTYANDYPISNSKPDRDSHRHGYTNSDGYSDS